MILRRLTTALRKQDWFTVVIETLIVVFGVFIGLQVNNWNEARVARGNEVLLLERLEEDFREAETAIAVAAAEAQQVAEDTGRLVELVRTHETPPDIDNLHQLLLAPALTSPLPTESATYLEMISTGSLSQIRDERLRRALTSYGQNIVRYDNNYQRALTAQSSTTARPLYIDAVRVNTEPSSATFIVGYDWAALRQAEPQLQTILVFQYNLASITQAQLDEVRTILALLEKPD
ncbi:hypothetical protein [uncultured Hyphomonas sp.]|jgi:hypothetical protein|uniref:hypothetical protein n=1 Tax=uncultured Hyphomonas sp. TaxID=225298 RepID=UPI000C60FDAD|nr:hypothetical protein [Hyphomonadaceae bacterium]|tara:strand:- start:80434 stop:81135 length:702 start_codon:yes stop_codon:yes gene_type:complete